MEALHADRAVFYRYIDGQGEYRVELGLGYNVKVMDQMQRMKIGVEDDYCLVGWVGKNRLPINVPDTYKDPRYIMVDPDVRSMILASVEHEDHLLGVLAMSGLRVNAFNPQAERLLNLYANEVAVAMENARLFNEAQVHLKRSQSLRSIDHSITASFDLQTTLNVMLDQFITQLGIDAVDVLLINSSSQTLHYVAGRGFRTAALQQVHVKIGAGPAGKAAFDRDILLAPDLVNEPDWCAHAPQLASEGFVSYFAVPFTSKGLVKGVLEIYSRSLMTPDREWLDFLESLEHQLTAAIENANMFDELRQSNTELIETYDDTLQTWVRGIDQHDRETWDHTRRVLEKTLLLAKLLGATKEELVHIRRGALLHDLGKIAIPDSILLKPGPLNEDEWALMRKHPVYAYEMIYPIAYLRPVVDIPYFHHEKWDGSGYPRGLTAGLIPKSVRIFSVVDVWVSLTSPRIYRTEPWTEEKARQYLLDRSGKDFDPVVVETFLKLEPG
jgi:response regulator RpfG family c-di-GMP phosphodiesterase